MEPSVKLLKDWLRPPIGIAPYGGLSKYIELSPYIPVIIPRVAINGGTLNLETTNPFTRPTIPQTAIAIKIGMNIGNSGKLGYILYA